MGVSPLPGRRSWLWAFPRAARTELRGLSFSASTRPCRLPKQASSVVSVLVALEDSSLLAWMDETSTSILRVLQSAPPSSSTLGRHSHRTSPASARRCHTPRHVPPSRFLTALTASSIQALVGLLHPTSDHGVHPVFHSLPTADQRLCSKVVLTDTIPSRDGTLGSLAHVSPHAPPSRLPHVHPQMRTHAMDA